MHTDEIRRICHACGHRRLKYMEEGQFPTDYCRAAHQECSKILSCDPTMRVPKGHGGPRKREEITGREAEFPVPDEL